MNRRKRIHGKKRHPSSFKKLSAEEAVEKFRERRKNPGMSGRMRGLSGMFNKLRNQAENLSQKMKDA